MPEALVFHLAIQLLDIVGRLHQAGILHADIKPDNVMIVPSSNRSPTWPDSWTAQEIDDAVLASSPNVKLIDFGRSLDLTLYPDRAATFLHTFVSADKCPEMIEGRPWSYQLDYFGLAVSIYTMLMGAHCKIAQVDGQWRVPALKRGHNAVWKDLTTALLNAAGPLDLASYRHLLAAQLVSSIKQREFTDRLRELDRYLASK